eukprot:XP_001694398.1 predicted protein [Chlamydomonas reinhardtii]
MTNKAVRGGVPQCLSPETSVAGPAGELDYDQRAGIRELGVLGKRCLARPGLIAGKYDYLGDDNHATLGKNAPTPSTGPDNVSGESDAGECGALLVWALPLLLLLLLSSWKLKEAVAWSPPEPTFEALPERFLAQLYAQLLLPDVKSLRSTCSGLAAACAKAGRLTSLRGTALLTEPLPSLSRLPPVSFLDLNARNADCGHRLISALRKHGGSVRAARLSGREGLQAALQALALSCPALVRLEELQSGFPGLQELHLTRLPISGEQLRALTARLPHLRALSDGCSFPASPALSGLRSLELSDAEVAPAAFAALNALTALTSLAAWGSGARAALGFAPLGALTGLRRLHLELVLDEVILSGLVGCSSLGHLSAQGARDMEQVMYRWAPKLRLEIDKAVYLCQSSNFVGLTLGLSNLAVCARSTAAASDGDSGGPQLLAVSLEGCVDSTDVGLAQALAREATASIPRVPAAVAAAAVSAAAASSGAGAWAALTPSLAAAWPPVTQAATLAVLLPAAVGLLLAFLVLMYMYRRLRQRHRRERGAKQAPGVGPLTTLLITDIANSTALWESLPEEVMDLALKLHHACLRSLLARFNGYESATEGDSFLLAFHNPVDAAKFALTAQVQLMDVMWPPEVLAHPDGQEVWVVPKASEPPPSGREPSGSLTPFMMNTGVSPAAAHALGRALGRNSRSMNGNVAVGSTGGGSSTATGTGGASRGTRDGIDSMGQRQPRGSIDDPRASNASASAVMDALDSLARSAEGARSGLATSGEPTLQLLLLGAGASVGGPARVATSPGDVGPLALGGAGGGGSFRPPPVARRGMSRSAEQVPDRVTAELVNAGTGGGGTCSGGAMLVTEDGSSFASATHPALAIAAQLGSSAASRPISGSHGAAALAMPAHPHPQSRTIGQPLASIPEPITTGPSRASLDAGGGLGVSRAGTGGTEGSLGEGADDKDYDRGGAGGGGTQADADDLLGSLRDDLYPPGSGPSSPAVSRLLDGGSGSSSRARTRSVTAGDGGPRRAIATPLAGPRYAVVEPDEAGEPGAQLLECRSYKEKCKDEWPAALRPAPPARCAYRGLRVRMGLHTGISTATDVTFNPTTSHMAYAVFSGESDLGLGPGGDRYSLYQLVHRELSLPLAVLPAMLPPLSVLAPGHLRREMAQSLIALQVARQLASHGSDVRAGSRRSSWSIVSPGMPACSACHLGTEAAPTGFCAISFMHVASASMLVAELGQPGVEALQQFKAIVTELCSRCGGYVVEASEGLCLAAFKHAAAALVWALSSREALAEHVWSPEHTTSAPYRGLASAFGVAPTTHIRHPRHPSVNVEVNAATGRMTYRGKVMNRTSRIAHKAASEQAAAATSANGEEEDEEEDGDGDGYGSDEGDLLPELATGAAGHTSGPGTLREVASERIARFRGLSIASGVTTAAGRGLARGPRSLNLTLAERVARKALALSRLAGGGVELPEGQRLAARFLGSYSLKGVREEMRLFEVSGALSGASGWAYGMTTTGESTYDDDAPPVSDSCNAFATGGMVTLAGNAFRASANANANAFRDAAAWALAWGDATSGAPGSGGVNTLLVDYHGGTAHQQYYSHHGGLGSDVGTAAAGRPAGAAAGVAVRLLRLHAQCAAMICME